MQTLYSNYIRWRKKWEIGRRKNSMKSKGNKIIQGLKIKEIKCIQKYRKKLIKREYDIPWIFILQDESNVCYL